jgi:ParB/RepB/Spo0J family partition protein
MNEVQLPWRQMIPADRLHPGPDNPRQDPGDDLDGLAASIRKNGLLQPVAVWPAPDLGDGHYYIEDGWRRWLAMKDWATAIPAVVKPLQIGDNAHVRSIFTGLVTSAHSKPLNPIERAQAYGRLRDEFGLTQKQIGEQEGRHGSTISDHLLLLELTEDTQKRVADGSLSIGKAKQLVKRKRAADRRKKGGSGQTGAVWEPDWFTSKHPLFRKAAALCDLRAHNSRRRFGRTKTSPGACGECFETLIREDERLVVTATAQSAAAWHELAGATGTGSSAAEGVGIGA